MNMYNNTYNIVQCTKNLTSFYLTLYVKENKTKLSWVNVLTYIYTLTGQDHSVPFMKNLCFTHSAFLTTGNI